MSPANKALVLTGVVTVVAVIGGLTVFEYVIKPMANKAA